MALKMGQIFSFMSKTSTEVQNQRSGESDALESQETLIMDQAICQEQSDDNLISQIRKQVDASFQVHFDDLAQHISRLEKRIEELETNQVEGKAAPDTSETNGGTDQTRSKTPPINADISATAVSSTVAKPNKFSGNVRVSYVTIEDNESESGGNKPPLGKPAEGEKENEIPTQIYSTFKDDKGKRIRTEIELRSKALIEFLGSFLSDTLKHQRLLPAWSSAQESVTISSRAVVTLPSYEELKMISLGNAQITTEAREELKSLIDHVEQYESTHVQMRKSTEKLREVTTERLWTLFPVGTEVVGKFFMDTPQIFIVHDFTPFELGHDTGAWVSCWCYDWDGQKLVKTCYDFLIKGITEPKSIVELPCYPLQYHEDQDKLRKDLIERGKRYKELYLPSRQSGSLVQCQGPVINVGRLTKSGEEGDSDDDDDDDTRQRYGSSEDSYDIIVDASDLIRTFGIRINAKQYAREEYNECTCKQCKREGSDSWERSFKGVGAIYDITMSIDEQTYENFFYLLPPRVFGVMIKQKLFAELPINQISSVSSKDFEKGWISLQLAQEHKTTIQYMVAAQLGQTPRTQSGEQTIIRDLVPGKGEGLVVLLHGVPGVGKTTTAETLARYLKRQLLRIDASDFDYEKPGQVGATLKKYFELASSWGVILLLDEADVFLQSRQRSEFKQNALVSVLLTQLEYFRGVLIMTTNRIMSIDVAVQSRLHYAIRFDYLNQDQLRAILKTFQAQLDESNCDTEEKPKIQDWLEENVENMKEKFMNGRDIRNLFMGTQWLAKKDGGKIRLEHLKRVYNAAQRFRTDMERTRIQKEAENSFIHR